MTRRSTIALESVRFLEADPIGANRYELSFERGTAIVALFLDPGGKIFFASPLMPPAPR